MTIMTFRTTVSQFFVEASVTQSEEGWTLVVSQLQGIPALAQLHQRLFAATGASCDGGPNSNHYSGVILRYV